MGGGYYSADVYNTTKTTKGLARGGVSAFGFDHDVKTGKVAVGCHDKLNPKGVTRESRDSVDHPTSNAIIVGFDNTGSMHQIPRVLQQKLTKFMTTLSMKAIIEDPQVLFSVFADVISDRVPLQVGQFESNNETDEDLDRVYLEGGGGGQMSESPELLFYFAARHTSIDCYEKRGKKGYLFFITDEMGRDLTPKAVEKVFGDTIEANIPIADIIKEASQKYEIFMIFPTQGSYGEPVKEYWKKLLGQNVLTLDNADLVCELLVTTIGITEETVDSIKAISKDLSINDSETRSLVEATAGLTKNRGLKNKAKVKGSLATTGSDSVKRL